MIIQLAKTGTWQDITITPQDLADCVANFNPDDRVPIIKGHDTTWDDSQPADGWINRVWLDGEYLIGDIELSEDMQTAYDNGEYQNWSVCMNYDQPTSSWYLHHLAFLGAVPPKIKGLQVVEMSDKVKNEKQRRITCSDLAVIEPDDAGDDDTKDKKMEDEENMEKLDEALKAKKEAEDKAADLEKEKKALSDRLAAAEAKEKKAKQAADDAEAKAFADAIAGKMPKEMADKVVDAVKKAGAGKVMLFSDTNKEEPMPGILAVLTEAFGKMPTLVPGGAHHFSDKPGEQGTQKKFSFNRI